MHSACSAAHALLDTAMFDDLPPLPPPDCTPDEARAWVIAAGLDVSDIEENLRMSPAERIHRHEALLDALRQREDAIARGEDPKPISAAGACPRCGAPALWQPYGGGWVPACAEHAPEDDWV